MSEQGESVPLWRAINLAIAEEMERDDSVLLFGQDVGAPGGTFGETRGLQARFGAERVMDAPISEQAIVGAATGAAIAGLRPIAEILFADFLTIGSDQLVNQAAKMRYFSGGAASIPMVVKAGVGVEYGMGAQHSQCVEGWFSQFPGLTVCWPATPADAKALLKASIRSDGPVLFLERLSDLNAVKGEIGGADDVAELGRAAIARPGGDVSLVTYGGGVSKCLAAAEGLVEGEGIEAEVVDLRTITPWDRRMVFDSVAKTNRCVVVTEAMRDFGPGAEIAASVSEHCFDDLDAPVLRVAAPMVPAPQFVQNERLRIPQPDQIRDRVLELT